LQDGNLGLVLSLPLAHQRHFILKLQDHYASYQLSLIDEDINRAIDVVSSLISSGELNATVDTTSGSTPVVRFLSSNTSTSSTMSEAEVQNHLAEQFARNKRLMEAVVAADRKIVLSQEFVQATRKARSDAEAAVRREGVISGDNLLGVSGPSNGSIGVGMPGGFGDNAFGDVDEDLMEG
jgi:hypothetical protein